MVEYSYFCVSIVKILSNTTNTTWLWGRNARAAHTSWRRGRSYVDGARVPVGCWPKHRWARGQNKEVGRLFFFKFFIKGHFYLWPLQCLTAFRTGFIKFSNAQQMRVCRRRRGRRQLVHLDEDVFKVKKCWRRRERMNKLTSGLCRDSFKNKELNFFDFISQKLHSLCIWNEKEFDSRVSFGSVIGPLLGCQKEIKLAAVSEIRQQLK